MIHVIPEQNVVNCDNTAEIFPLGSSKFTTQSHKKSLSCNTVWVAQNNHDLEENCYLCVFDDNVKLRGKPWHTCLYHSLVL